MDSWNTRINWKSDRQMKICDEISRLFRSKENYTSAAELKRLVATKSGKTYLNDGTQQDTVEFMVTLLQEVQEEISADNLEARVLGN